MFEGTKSLDIGPLGRYKFIKNVFDDRCVGNCLCSCFDVLTEYSLGRGTCHPKRTIRAGSGTHSIVIIIPFQRAGLHRIVRIGRKGISQRCDEFLDL